MPEDPAAAAALATYRACGKAILFGEHFVVHGAPALALPVTAVQTEVRVLPAVGDVAGGGHALESDAPHEVVAQARQQLQRAVQLLELSAAGPWRLVARSTIPIGCGLGSSAAFAVALVGALMRAAGREPGARREELNAHAHVLEGLVHGTPSGIDDTVITYERPLWFCRAGTRERLRSPRGLRLLLASSGQPGSTRLAVSKVGELREADPARFERLCGEAREVARQGRAAFEAADPRRLGRLLDRNHALLRQLGVSTERLDHLVEVARRAGAHGAKLTGAGRGGFVLAAVDAQSEREVTLALRRAGAPEVLTTRTGEHAR